MPHCGLLRQGGKALHGVSAQHKSQTHLPTWPALAWCCQGPAITVHHSPLFTDYCSPLTTHHMGTTLSPGTHTLAFSH